MDAVNRGEFRMFEEQDQHNAGPEDLTSYEVYDADGKYDSHHDEYDLDVAESEAEGLGGKVVRVTYTATKRETVSDYTA